MSLEKLKTLSSSELSDALDSLNIEGVLLGIFPRTLNKLPMIGPAFTVRYEAYEEKPSTFKSAGNYIDAVPGGSVIVIDNQGRNDCTTWGGILTQVATQKKLQGTVISGACRDIKEIHNLNYPLFSTGVTMRSGKNRVYKSTEQIPLCIQGITIKPGDIIFGDENGVLVIPQDQLSEVTHRALNIQKTEGEILQSVKAGMSLEKARETHRYDQPWLSHKV